MIYLDTSALVKLVRVEAESLALSRWLAARSTETPIASSLVDVEIRRALRRSQPEALPAIDDVLAHVARVAISAAVRDRAAVTGPPGLRTLDAIHLATAELLVSAGQRITAFITYDERLGGSARAAGFELAAPR